jgi:hypothetical protein
VSYRSLERIEADLEEMRRDLKALAGALAEIAALIPGGKEVIDATALEMMVRKMQPPESVETGGGT